MNVKDNKSVVHALFDLIPGAVFYYDSEYFLVIDVDYTRHEIKTFNLNSDCIGIFRDNMPVRSWVNDRVEIVLN